jgi:hypothetical protein
VKAWRKAAAVAKKVALAEGKHERGRRYGRFMKAAVGSVVFKPVPSTLFQRIGIHAGILQGELW